MHRLTYGLIDFESYFMVIVVKKNPIKIGVENRKSLYSTQNSINVEIVN